MTDPIYIDIAKKFLPDATLKILYPHHVGLGRMECRYGEQIPKRFSDAEHQRAYEIGWTEALTEDVSHE